MVLMYIPKKVSQSDKNNFFPCDEGKYKETTISGFNLLALIKGPECLLHLGEVRPKFRVFVPAMIHQCDGTGLHVRTLGLYFRYLRS